MMTMDLRVLHFFSKVQINPSDNFSNGDRRREREMLSLIKLTDFEGNYYVRYQH